MVRAIGPDLAFAQICHGENLITGLIEPRANLGYEDFFLLATLFPFFRASERPMAIAWLARGGPLHAVLRTYRATYRAEASDFPLVPKADIEPCIAVKDACAKVRVSGQVQGY